VRRIERKYIVEVTILEGYQPGAVGTVAALHGAYYAREWNFGLFFEAKVASELAGFLTRYDARSDLFLAARVDHRIVGSATLDGADPDAAPGFAHLRWVIVGDEVQGVGLGRLLVARIMKFARKAGFRGVYLWTFKGLDTAKRLYLEAGFELVEEIEGNRWGRVVTQQRYVAKFEVDA